MTTHNFTYPEAINLALIKSMRKYPNLIIMGQGVDDHKRILGTTNNLLEEFGSERIFDTPIAEEGMTGVAIGLATSGFRVVHTHIRMDFLLLAMNQIVNMAAKFKYMYGGRVNVPIVIRAIIGKSWGQGPQHSQGLYSMFMNVPGLKVVAPATPYDAQNLLMRAIEDDGPVLFIEHRHLYYQKSNNPENYYRALGTQSKLNDVHDKAGVTLVGVSHMAIECLRASKIMNKYFKIQAAVFSLQGLSPMHLDEKLLNSIKITKRLVVVDCGWKVCGAGAELITRLQEEGLEFKFKRMGFAQTTCPTSKPLEDEFYPDARKIAIETYELITGKMEDKKLWEPEIDFEIEENIFKGPF